MAALNSENLDKPENFLNATITPIKTYNGEKKRKKNSCIHMLFF